MRNTSALNVNAQGKINITGSEIVGTESGISVAPGTKFDVFLRNTTISGVNSAVNVNCDATSTVDLGTLVVPGGNTFAAKTNLRVSGSGPLVHAIGNTWTASTQGADVGGKYQAQGAGAVLEATSGSGPNFTLGTNKARLAQNN